uniref:Uncharacterized protein n=1 Tax=Rhizophora mucronata TaxID=61149 RepID=A0A2P2Q8A4_RHIMU
MNAAYEALKSWFQRGIIVVVSRLIVYEILNVMFCLKELAWFIQALFLQCFPIISGLVKSCREDRVCCNVGTES